MGVVVFPLGVSVFSAPLLLDGSVEVRGSACVVERSAGLAPYDDVDDLASGDAVQENVGAFAADVIGLVVGVARKSGLIVFDDPDRPRSLGRFRDHAKLLLSAARRVSACLSSGHFR
jgi:hypothetical protein